MEDKINPYPAEVNLDNCSKEPIHIIGSTQEFGLLLVADPKTFKILQIGTNSSQYIFMEPQEVLGEGLEKIFGEAVVGRFKDQVEDQENLSPQQVNIKGRTFFLLAHLSEAHLILDLEPLKEETELAQEGASSLFMDFRQSGIREDVFQKTARLAKKYFGYDRVMIYKFDEEWNGEVVAEAKAPEMESWFGLHYPASDIPEQSRAMFLKNGIRMISDVDYTPVPIEPRLSPVSKAPINISLSALRAVSPIHIEYLKNMKVAASLTAAIEVNGKLWGLIACHHRTPKFLGFYQRESCHFLARMLAMEIAMAETGNYMQKITQMNQKRQQLVQQIRKAENVAQGLCEGPLKFTDLFSCGGGALYINGNWNYLGSHPSPQEVQELLDKFLIPREETLFHTESLLKQFPDAEAYKEIASGLLSLQLAENKYLLWFRPEALRTVQWGGDPNHKAFYNEKEQRLSPRRSFEKWTELKQGTSLPWKDYDLNAAKALGENLSHEFLARQRNEIETLYIELSEANKELELFSYGLSHDLRAPVRGMQGLLDIVLEDHAENLDQQARSYLEKTHRLSTKLELLIDDILAYSKIHHSRILRSEELETRELLEEAFELLSVRAQYPQARIHLQEDLPSTTGDRSLLLQVWTNLLANALKYSREANPPMVEIGSSLKDGRQVFYIRDNGIGFPEKYKEAIFEPFRRAVGSEYKGTGIGLALAKKIIEKHQGEIWAESQPGKGSIFYLYLPPKI